MNMHMNVNININTILNNSNNININGNSPIAIYIYIILYYIYIGTAYGAHMRAPSLDRHWSVYDVLPSALVDKPLTANTCARHALALHP